MALTSNVVSVGGSAVALHTAGPTSIQVRNVGYQTVYLGTSGAQKFPLSSGEKVTVPLATAETLYGRCDDGTSQVAVLFA